jgi:hypothetical protein
MKSNMLLGSGGYGTDAPNMEEPEPENGRTRTRKWKNQNQKMEEPEYMMLLNIPDNISGSNRSPNRPPQL